MGVLQNQVGLGNGGLSTSMFIYYSYSENLKSAKVHC